MQAAPTSLQHESILCVVSLCVLPQQHTVSIADLEVTSIPSQEKVLNANKQVLTDFGHRGRVTCLQVCLPSTQRTTVVTHCSSASPAYVQVKQWADGNVLVVTGSAQGTVSRMRFRVPLAPGSALDQIQAWSSVPLSPCAMLKFLFSNHN